MPHFTIFSKMCILFDLPSCLTFEICSVWIGVNAAVQGSGLKALLRLDSALFNKQLRQSLLDVYSRLNWETFLSISGRNNSISLKMKWIVARQILLPKLVLSHFPNEQETIRSFFKCNGKVLKVLKLSDFEGAMTLLTKAIAVDCKVLETLCLERCNLTMPIADILKKTVSIREVRFQNRIISCRSRARTEGPRGVKTALFERVICRSVVKLALLDPVTSDDADVIARAFPNIRDIELYQVGADALIKLLSAWKNVEVLRLMSMSVQNMTRPIIPDIIARVKDSLKTVVLGCVDVSMLGSIKVLLENCGNVSSVVFRDIFSFESDLLTRTAQCCNARLEVLEVMHMKVTAGDVEAIAEHCPNLRVLGMRRLGTCSNYELLLRNCTRLEKLRVAPGNIHVNNQHVSNSAALLSSIATHCNNLQLLGYYTSSVDFSQISVLTKCPNLHVFETACSKWYEFIGKLKDVEIRYLTDFLYPYVSNEADY